MTGSATASWSTRNSATSRQRVAKFELVADLDMAGARGSALAALHAVRPERP